MIDSSRKMRHPWPSLLAPLDRASVSSVILALGCVLTPGCGRDSDRTGLAERGAHGHAEHPDARPAHSHNHAHSPPHGGVPVVLGDEAYHLELLLDSAAGTLMAYVMDGHMENFIRIAAPAIEMDVIHADGAKRLALTAVESASTGEKSGDTSLFSATHPVLRGLTQFDAIIHRIEIRSQVFEQIRFNYPKGNE